MNWMTKLVLACALLSPAVGAQSFEITQVAPGVYAAIGRSGVFSNGAFIVNKEDVLVVDTHLRPAWARDLIAEIKKVTDKPVRYVVNSHWHNDHTQGNQAYVNVFGPAVEYISQHTAREDIRTKAIPSIQDSLNKGVPDRIAQIKRMLAENKNQQGQPLTEANRADLQRQLAGQEAYLDELKQLQITLPTLTFERSLSLHKTAPDGSERSIQILFFGKGHTRGDVVVFLPKEKVVITGDLLTGGVPFARDSYPSLWAGTLENVHKLDFAQVIPGHGGVQQGKQRLELTIALFKDLVAYVKDGMSKGLSAEQIAADFKSEKYDKDFPNARNSMLLFISRAHAEASGKVTD